MSAFVAPTPGILRNDLAAMLVDWEEEARLSEVLDAEYDRVAGDFYQLTPRIQLRESGDGVY